MDRYAPASLASVDLQSPFFNQLIDTVRQATIPAVLDALKSTGRYYALNWTRETKTTAAHCFWDSDLFKSMEGFCYFLMKQNDDDLMKHVNEIVDWTKKAQWQDGYVNSFYTLEAPAKRLTNLRDMHELYCLGHLAEFAVAHHQLTGSLDLVDVVRRFVELLHKTIIPKGGYPGHQELELALMRLYELTQDRLFLDTAGFFIQERGKHDADSRTFFDRECIARGEDPFVHDGGFLAFRHARDYAYMQAHVPLIEQPEIDGHCVRAVYLLTGALDYASYEVENATEIQEAVQRLFDDIVNKKMYITGGIGALTQNEGFGIAYCLPDHQHSAGGGCYSETCASFGLVMLCERFLRYSLDSKYSDVMERALFNNILGSLGMEGKSFYYENPLATVPERPWHRSKWFNVSCCPPNIVKIWGLLPTLIYSTRESTVAIHLYISSTLTTVIKGSDVTIDMQSGLPWDGAVKIGIATKESFELALRIPEWCRGQYTTSSQGTVNNGYLCLQVTPDMDHVTLSFSTDPYFVYANPRTHKDEVAVVRGPLVYCAEGPDNDFDLESLYVSSTAPITDAGEVKVMDVAGVPQLEVQGGLRVASEAGSDLYSSRCPSWTMEQKTVRLVPYFLRENRGGNGAMRVWLKYQPNF